MPTDDPARDFFILAHAIIASEMNVRAVSRYRTEPKDTDPLYFWFAWRARQGFENHAENYR